MADVVAGWYDDGSGRQRWWDGDGWTSDFQDDLPTAVVVVSDESTASRGKTMGQRFTSASSAVVSARDKVSGALSDKSDTGTVLPGTLWSASAKTLTGLGGGRYRLTAEYLFFEKGTLSTSAQQIRTHHIYDVDASQTMTQKARGIGDIVLWSENENGEREKVVLSDVPDFRTGVAAINEVAFAMRERLRLRDIDDKVRMQHSHQTVNYSGLVASALPGQNMGVAAPALALALAGQSAVPSVQPPAGQDLNAELGRLAEFHSQGILTDEEFTAAKRKLLGL